MPKRRRHLHPVLPEPHVGIVVGWGMPDRLEEVKQLTHDTLIHLMGMARTGAVSWRFLEGDAAVKMLDRMGSDEADLRMLMHYAHIRRHVEGRGGIMVVATAPGRPPRGQQ